MTVAELIVFLQEQPQEVEVAYCLYSEQALLKKEDIHIKNLCYPRSDEWIENQRPDKPYKEYLVFPGN